MNFCSVAHLAIVQLHEHVVGRLQAVRVRLRAQPTALRNNKVTK
jgi:hypothetical protein